MKLTEQEYAQLLRLKATLDTIAETLDDMRFRSTDGVERQALERASARVEQAAFELVEFT